MKSQSEKYPPRGSVLTELVEKLGKSFVSTILRTSIIEEKLLESLWKVAIANLPLIYLAPSQDGVIITAVGCFHYEAFEGKMTRS